MFSAFKNQDDKVVNLKNLLDNNTEEINHLINKTNDDLNKAIESNYEDTTLGKRIFKYFENCIPTLTWNNL